MSSLTLRIIYLAGRSVATVYNDRDAPEWPPHPARVYSALVATWADHDDREPAERLALEWLASLDAPSIYASDASRRRVVPHFVPVNDTAVLDTFERQRAKFDELSRAYAAAQAEYEHAARNGEEKAKEKHARALGRAEKACAAEQKKLGELVQKDQQAYAAGKHPAGALRAAAALLPDNRGKQPRAFPSVSPHESRVFMRWTADAALIEQHRPALSAIASRIVRIGHSSSLVACSVVDDCPTPTWEPRDNGHEVMRVPGPRQLEQLERAYDRHREIEPRVMPCRFQHYAKASDVREEASAISCFDDEWIVFRQVAGRRVSATLGVEVARAMRGALMKHTDDPVPEVVSGHSESGEPSDKPHLAIIPLPFVGSPHATGELLGLALILPRGAEPSQREVVLRTVGCWEDERRAEDDDDQVDAPPLRLMLGSAGLIEVERVIWGSSTLKTLRSTTWCQPSRTWITVTPIALDRNPGDLFSRDREKVDAAYRAAELSIATACERIGLPTPSSVQIHPSVPLRGALKARAYPPFPADPQKHRRVKAHARIEFPVRVTGPVLLGAGRYQGLGLCMPQPQEDEPKRDATA